MAAAKRLFAQRGYKGTTTRAIAEEAGVNEVTVFRSLGSKEKILYEILSTSLPDEADAPLARVLAREPRTEEELGAMLGEFMRIFRSRILPPVADLLRIALREADERPEFRDFLSARSERLKEALSNRLQSLEGRLCPSKASSLVASFMVEGLVGGFLMAGPKPVADGMEGQGDLERLGGLLARGLIETKAGD